MLIFFLLIVIFILIFILINEKNNDIKLMNSEKADTNIDYKKYYKPKKYITTLNEVL